MVYKVESGARFELTDDQNNSNFSGTSLRIEIDKDRYLFHRPADLETLWSEMDDCSNEDDIPYWTEIWPAAIALAKYIKLNQKILKDQWALDLGCGLGLTACVASVYSPKIVALDYDWSALSYAKKNSEINKTSEVNWLQMDWKDPGFKPGSFPFIWGADIIYERRFFEPLVQLFDKYLTPKGKIWLTSPDREVSGPFWPLLEENNWQIDHLRQEKICYGEYNMLVHLLELKRKD